MRTVVLVALFAAWMVRGHCQDVSWYNTDSLLSALSKNEKIAGILREADAIYNRAQLDSNNISRNAFRVGYLEKRLIDQRNIHVRHRHRYRNKRILSIVDYTRKGNAMRFAIVDVQRELLLHDTLVSQGSGRGDKKNNKFQLPVFFGNTLNSEVSSLGLIVTKKARQTDNPCHLCRYAATIRHKDVIVLQGMEKGINDNVKKRDIVIHTTGSKDLSDALSEKELHIKDANYKVIERDCKCYRTGDNDSVKSISAYASACGLAENNSYMGQSNGCLVLPEDHHIEIMKIVKRKSLIFIYSNVISGETNYFKVSPLIRKIVRYAGR